MSDRLPIIEKKAVIRKPGTRDCPYGLVISVSCQNAGITVDQMTILDDVDKKKRNQQAKANRRVYVFHQDGERCAYADKIVEDKNIVHCDYGEGGARMRDFAMRPSPFYPRIFHGLGQYGLYSYRMTDYGDNGSAGHLFNGIYAMYSATGEIMISKESVDPDPILEKLAANLSINED